MSFLDSLMFWKRKDDFGLDSMPEFSTHGDFGKHNDFGGKGFGQNDFGMNSPPGMDFNREQPSSFGGDFGSNHNEPSFGQSHSQQSSFSQQQSPSQQPSFRHQQPTSFGGQQQFSQQPSFGQQQYPQHGPSNEIVSKDIEIISSKLDSLKASIDIVNQRLANIERMANAETQKKNNWY